MANITRVPWTINGGSTITDESGTVIQFAVPSDLRFTTTPGIDAYVGTPYIYAVLAMDSLEDTFLSLSLNTAPSWLSLTTVSDGGGILAGLPPIEDVGQHTVIIDATDGFLTVQQEYILTVQEGSPDEEQDAGESDLGESTILIFHKEV